MEGNDPSCPSPSTSTSTSLFKDISNYKTPKRPLTNNRLPKSSHEKLFTASKPTPNRPSSSIRRPSFFVAPSSLRSKKCLSKTVKRVKAFELEQSQSSRKTQLKKERELKSLARSLTVWLNFLFENPRSCGCDTSINGDNCCSDNGERGKGKRDGNGDGDRIVGVDVSWRSPKKLRNLKWQSEEESVDSFSSSKYSNLRNSMKEVCSLDDLMQRMRMYLNLGSCKEIFDVMTQVTKNIDEGRIKMIPHCPIVTDVGLKKKAITTLMCYNPVWLRVGLYIILGGDSLLSSVDYDSHKEIGFLKMVIEKQLFSHAGLSKVFSYNKMVEGLYRPGYYESLGNIILKRILMLVLILDRAKSKSSLSLKYGIDGTDGGSPLLFLVNCGIKSSRQVVYDFLSSDVMLGEGNLVTHLAIIGYKIPYEQCHLVEFQFRVTDIRFDLQDGVRLCRAIQLLQHDPSILTKLVIPSDTRKKNLENCGTALQYLRKAGVTLHDNDGVMIIGDDVANGDKELTLSLLWNMFVHLQLPLLINKAIVVEEIHKIRKVDMDYAIYINSPPSEMLLKWIQAVCEAYDFKLENLSSLVDGRAIWCLLDFYFRRELGCSCLSNKDQHNMKGDQSVMTAANYTDAVHNFILSQKLTALLGHFPEVFQIGDLLEHKGASNDQSVIILAAFLCARLTVKENLDQLNFHKLLCCSCRTLEKRHSLMERGSNKSEVASIKEAINGDNIEENADAAIRFKAIKSWWQEMAERNYKFATTTAAPNLQDFSSAKESINIRRENAARTIQSHFRRYRVRAKFMKIKNAVRLLQTVNRAWLAVRQIHVYGRSISPGVPHFVYDTWKFIFERHHFVKVKKSVVIIQRAARTWIIRRQLSADTFNKDVSAPSGIKSPVATKRNNSGQGECLSYIGKDAEIDESSVMCLDMDQVHVEHEAATKIQLAWKNFVFLKVFCIQSLAAVKIQSFMRGWLLRNKFLDQKRASIKIQSYYRRLKCWRTFQCYKLETRSAIIIQCHVRRYLACLGARRHRFLIVVIQRYYRGRMARRHYLAQRHAAIKLQTIFRCLRCLKLFSRHRCAAIQIQSSIKGQLTRNRLLGASWCRAAKSQMPGFSSQTSELSMVLDSVVKLQRWWKGVMSRESRKKSVILIQRCFRRWNTRQKASKAWHQIILIQAVVKLQRWWKGVNSRKSRKESVIFIQSCFRGWNARRKASNERHQIILIQSHWKGYLARKASRSHLSELRYRMQISARNVDDSKRLINKLLAALSELLNMKSVRNILYTCETLDKATEYSEKCCEELVAAGAISKLLRLIRSSTRSIPDQEVVKHALSTLKNLARYPDLLEKLINCQGALETMFLELFKNKEDGFFIVSGILNKICSNREGRTAVRRSPPLLKRLHNLVEDLKKKAITEKRKGLATRDLNDNRRLKEAIELLKLVKS